MSTNAFRYQKGPQYIENYTEELLYLHIESTYPKNTRILASLLKIGV